MSTQCPKPVSPKCPKHCINLVSKPNVIPVSKYNVYPVSPKCLNPVSIMYPNQCLPSVQIQCFTKCPNTVSIWYPNYICHLSKYSAHQVCKYSVDQVSIHFRPGVQIKCFPNVKIQYRSNVQHSSVFLWHSYSLITLLPYSYHTFAKLLQHFCHTLATYLSHLLHSYHICHTLTTLLQHSCHNLNISTIVNKWVFIEYHSRLHNLWRHSTARKGSCMVCCLFVISFLLQHEPAPLSFKDCFPYCPKSAGTWIHSVITSAFHIFSSFSFVKFWIIWTNKPT